MITMKVKMMVAVAGAAMILATPLHADDAVKYQSRFGSKVHIDGTSTIHDWTMDGKAIKGTLELPAGAALDSTQAAATGTQGGKLDAHATISIPVASMKSGHEGMDEVMQQAMNEKTHPTIDYRLTELTIKDPHTAGTPFQCDTKGELVINGVTNSIAMPVTIESPEKGRLKVVGKIPLKMSDYQIKAPAPKIALGMITTGDEVKISFEWLLGQPAK